MRVNLVPLVFGFLGSYYTLVTTAAFIGDPASEVELYREPDLHAALFFAAFEVIGAAYFLLAGLLAGLLAANVWEGWRKQRVVRKRRAIQPRGVTRTCAIPLPASDQHSLANGRNSRKLTGHV